MGTTTLLPCLHCGGQLREDSWDPGTLVCWQCGRTPAPEVPPAQRPERSTHWTPDQDVRLIVLHQDEGLSIEDIALDLGTSPSSVNSRLQRLRRQGQITHRRQAGRPMKAPAESLS